MKFSYLPATRKSSAPSTFTKTFDLPLASSEALSPHQRHSDSLLILRHRVTGQWFALSDNSSGSRGNIFGQVRSNRFESIENSTMVRHHWEHRLQRNLPDFPDFKEWQKDAELLVLSRHLFQTIRVPFEVTLAVPDLKTFQNRFNELPE